MSFHDEIQLQKITGKSKGFNYIFEQLTEDTLDESFHYYGNEDYYDYQVSPEDKSTTEFLESIYLQMEQWIEAVQSKWNSVPNISILSDFKKNIRFLSRLLRNSRYPRLALIGRRGAGKTSVINAILGEQVAQPGHVRAQTGRAKLLRYRTIEGNGLDVVDTRGLNEGGKPVEDDCAENAIDSVVEALRTCPIDAILFVHKIKDVDSAIQNDLEALLEVLKKSNLLSSSVPIIFVLTHTDEMEPSDLRKPEDYDETKLKSIEEAKNQFLLNVENYAHPLLERTVGTVAISCAVIWLPPDDGGTILPNPKRDYRYNIDGLLSLLLTNVQVQAVFKTVQAARSLRVRKEFAEFLCRVFASLAAILSLTPIPATDIIPLTALISYQSYTIARLGSTENWSFNSVSKFLGVLGATGLVGFGARYLMTQSLKFFMVPGSSAASAAVTYSVVLAAGKAAILFFLENKSEDEVRRIFEETRNGDASKEVETLFEGNKTQ